MKDKIIINNKTKKIKFKKDIWKQKNKIYFLNKNFQMINNLMSTIFKIKNKRIIIIKFNHNLIIKIIMIQIIKFN